MSGELNPKGIDDDMKRCQWVCWGHDGKAPTDPTTGGYASHTDPATWGSWDDALAMAERKGYGVGFPFQQDAPFIGLDVDVPDSDGWVPDFDRIGGAVVERSPSGNGHVFLWEVEVPEWWTDLSGDGPETDEIGVYVDSKYTTVTGDVLEGHGPPIEEVSQGAFEDWLKDAWVGWHEAHLEHDDYPDEVPTPPWESPDSTLEGDFDEAGSSQGSGETDVDIGIYDVISPMKYSEGERDSHPYHGSKSGTNFMVDEDGESFRCWRHEVTGHAGHLLGMDVGILDCGEWDRREITTETWREIYDAARSQGYDVPPKDHTKGGDNSPAEATADGGTATAAGKAVAEAESEPNADGDGDNDTETDPWPKIRESLALPTNDVPNEPARYEAYRLVRDEFVFATFRDTEELYVYDPEQGIYQEGGEAVVREWLEADHRLGDQYKRSEASEIIYRIKSATFREREEFGGSEYDPKVCVENGVLNLAEFADPEIDEPEVRFLDHSPDHLLLTQVPVAYDPDAECPGFDGFLDDIVAKDNDKALVYEYIGYFLWPGYPFAKALFLYGDGRNGKSRLLDVMKAFLGGDENVASRGLYELEMQRFAAGDLFGRMANIAGDLPDQDLSRTGTFKTLTGGDLVTGEEKYKDAFSFKNQAKLVFAANDPPKIEDDTTAMYRRLLLLNFPNEFTPPGKSGPDARPKHELLAEIANDEELSGLLNAALAGLARVFTRGRFSQNETPDQVREQYKRVSDPIYAFAHECVRQNPDEHVEKSVLYNIYAEWARANEAPVKDPSVFPRKLGTHLRFESGKVGGRGDRKRVYQGVELTDKGRSFTGEEDSGNDRQQYL
jgi:putative DNA primase/helicase